LPGDHQRLGRVDAADHNIRAAVNEPPGLVGRVERDAGDVEPEADPGDGHIQVVGILATVLFVAIARAEVDTGGQAAGLEVDQGAKVADLAGLGRQRRRTARDLLAQFHVAHDVAQVGGRLTGQRIVAGHVNKDGVRVLLGDKERVFLKLVGSGEDDLGAFGQHLVHHLLQRGLRRIGGVQALKEDHPRAGYLLLNILPGGVMGLAPAMVVARANEDHAEDELLVLGEAAYRCQQHGGHHNQNNCGSACHRCLSPLAALTQ